MLVYYVVFAPPPLLIPPLLSSPLLSLLLSLRAVVCQSHSGLHSPNHPHPSGDVLLQQYRPSHARGHIAWHRCESQNTHTRTSETHTYTHFRNTHIHTLQNHNHKHTSETHTHPSKKHTLKNREIRAHMVRCTHTHTHTLTLSLTHTHTYTHTHTQC